MRIQILTIVTLILFLSSHSFSSDKTALVIGNSQYKASPLPNPVNDANDMAQALQRFGFSVIKIINADKRTMRKSLRDFGDRLSESKSVGLFFYAGHGLQLNGVNYLVPVDSDIQREDEIPDECINANLVLRKMETAKNRLNIIILDACRDNPFKRSFRSSSRGLAEMQPPTGSIIAFATGPGSVAADGSGRNGLYTSKLLKHIQTPGLTIERVLKKVRIDVIKASDKKQVPWDLSSLTGDFYFSNDRGLKIASVDKKVETKKIETIKTEEKQKVELKDNKTEFTDRKRPDFIFEGRLNDTGRKKINLELNLLSFETKRKVWVGNIEFALAGRTFVHEQIRKLALKSLEDIWLQRFRYKNKKTPVITAGKFVNNSHLIAGDRIVRRIILRSLSEKTEVSVLIISPEDQPPGPPERFGRPPIKDFPPRR